VDHFKCPVPVYKVAVDYAAKITKAFGYCVKINTLNGIQLHNDKIDSPVYKSIQAPYQSKFA
jgi:hypothetical protein